MCVYIYICCSWFCLFCLFREFESWWGSFLLGTFHCIGSSCSLTLRFEFVCLSPFFSHVRRYAADFLYGADDPILIQALAPEFEPCWMSVASCSSAAPTENTAIGDLATVVERNLHVSSVPNNLPTATVRIVLSYKRSPFQFACVVCHIVAQHQKNGGFQQQHMYRHRQRRPTVQCRALTHWPSSQMPKTNRSYPIFVTHVRIWLFHVVCVTYRLDRCTLNPDENSVLVASPLVASFPQQRVFSAGGTLLFSFLFHAFFSFPFLLFKARIIRRTEITLWACRYYLVDSSCLHLLDSFFPIRRHLVCLCLRSSYNTGGRQCGVSVDNLHRHSPSVRILPQPSSLAFERYKNKKKYKLLMTVNFSLAHGWTVRWQPMTQSGVACVVAWFSREFIPLGLAVILTMSTPFFFDGLQRSLLIEHWCLCLSQFPLEQTTFVSFLSCFSPGCFPFFFFFFSTYTLRYMRRFDLGAQIVKDVSDILSSGKRTILRCLLRTHCILSHSDAFYLMVYSWTISRISLYEDVINCFSYLLGAEQALSWWLLHLDSAACRSHHFAVCANVFFSSTLQSSEPFPVCNTCWNCTQ